MADDTPIINLKDHHFSVGVGMYGIDYKEYCEYDEDGNLNFCEYEKFETSIDLSQV